MVLYLADGGLASPCGYMSPISLTLHVMTLTNWEGQGFQWLVRYKRNKSIIRRKKYRFREHPASRPFCLPYSSRAYNSFPASSGSFDKTNIPLSISHCIQARIRSRRRQLDRERPVRQGSGTPLQVPNARGW